MRQAANSSLMRSQMRLTVDFDTVASAPSASASAAVMSRSDSPRTQPEITRLSSALVLVTLSSLPPEVSEDVETALVDGLVERVGLGGIADAAELVAAASFVETYGIDLGPVLAETDEEIGRLVERGLEGIGEGDMALDVDRLLWAAESFGIVPEEALVTRACQGEGRYEPDEDDWRERGGYRSGGGDVSEIDRLFWGLSVASVGLMAVLAVTGGGRRGRASPAR